METTENTGSGESRNRLKNTTLVILGAGVIALGAFGFYERNQKEKYKEDLKTQISELQQKSVSTCQAIENNLAEINAKEGLLPAPGKETNSTSEERIQKNIAMIEHVMKKNHELIESLKTSVGERDKKLLRFQKLMAKLDKRLNDYKTKTETLTAQTESLQKDLDDANKMRESISAELAQKQKELDDKAAEVEKQSAQIKEKDNALHTGYYTVGTYKELKENNVVEKGGGVLGLGRENSLKKDFSRKNFSKVDIYTFTSIPVFSERAQIITNHSTDSYEIVRGPKGEVQWIKITNPEKFWENSKYLVVLKKGEPTAASASVE
jgi:myosin heavy subunit